MKQPRRIRQHRSPNPAAAQHRAPPKTTQGRTPRDVEIDWALSVVERSGVLAIVPFLERRRPRTVTLVGTLVAAITAARAGKPMHMRCIAEELNAMTPAQLDRLGMGPLKRPERTYKQVSAKFCTLATVLDTAPEVTISGTPLRLDPITFANLLVIESIPRWARTRSASRAIDGTDIETTGRFRGHLVDDDSDNDDDPTQPAEAPPRRRTRTKTKAEPLGYGPDGRAIYTADTDARATHRSATDRRDAGLYVGYELHTAVMVPHVKWTDGISRVTIGEAVPNLIAGLNLTPGGHHRGEAAVGILELALQLGEHIDEIIVDGGYSRSKPQRFHHPVRKLGIDITMPLFENQRGPQPLQASALLIDGTLFSPHTPPHHLGVPNPDTAEIRPFPMPPLGATEEEKLAYEKPFNARAIWRHGLDAKRSNGSTRWQCPFCQGRLAATNFPTTSKPNAPLVTLAPKVTRCCGGTITITADEHPWRQPITFGTTAWRRSYGRRSLAESANSGLHAGPIHITRGYFRIFGLTKHTILSAIAAIAYNDHRLHSYVTKHHLDPHSGQPLDHDPHRRRRRRTPNKPRTDSTPRGQAQPGNPTASADPTSGIPPP